ncbi:hypothetical protein PuT2_00435 [Pusillimonas sp. T2]|nr:hypothetical protein PuT2_00435 [Pusillimonas sp. T2]
MFAASNVFMAQGPLSWRVRPSAGLLSFAALTIGTATMALGLVHWALMSLVAVFLLVWRRTRAAHALLARGQLAYTPAGWSYQAGAGAPCALSLSRAWLGPAFLTLGFHGLSPTGPSQALEITLFKATLGPHSWQRLCLLVAQDLQFSEPRSSV